MNAIISKLAFSDGSNQTSSYGIALNYGTTSTGEDIATKVVVCPDFELMPKAMIAVKFDNGNMAENALMSVNETTAKPIYKNGAAISPGVISAGDIVLFRYNGNQYDVIGGVGSGGSDGEIATFPLNETIAATDWQGEGPYTYTITDARINSNMFGHTWLSNPEAVLGATTIASGTGSLTITTSVLPTQAWSFHTFLISNDTDLMDEIEITVNSKANKVQNAVSGNFAGLDSNGNLTDSGSKSTDFLAANQGSTNAGMFMKVGNDGILVPDEIEANDFSGATASAAGTHGFVPAPAVADREKFLCGDGTWSIPVGGKLITFDLDTVTNTSGSYTHTTTASGVTGEMKAVVIEVSNSSAFNADILIVTSDNAITLSCDDVSGTSEVTVSLLFLANASSITSSEFDILSGRIGTLSQLQTTAKSSLVAAVNEHESDISGLNSKIKRHEIAAQSSESDLKTALLSLSSGMADGEVQNISFYVSMSNDNLDAYSVYNGWLYRQGAGIIKVHAINISGNDIQMAVENNVWSVKSNSKACASLNSKITNKLKIVEGVAKIVNAVTTTSGQVANVEFNVSSLIDPSKVVYILSASVGINPAGVFMSVAQGYNGNTGIRNAYMLFQNDQTIAANTDVGIRLLAVD